MEKSEIFPELDKQRRIEDRSQEEMAEEIGISRQSYNNYRTGKTKPNEDILFRMFEYIKDDTKVVMQIKDKASGKTLFLDREEALDLKWQEKLPFHRGSQHERIEIRGDDVIPFLEEMTDAQSEKLKELAQEEVEEK